MGIQSGLAAVILAQQSAKGTAAATPAFMTGLRSGAVWDVPITQDREEVTLNDSLVSPGINRTEAVPGMDFTCRMYPGLTAALMNMILGATVTTGGGAPYTHTANISTSIPYVTGWGVFAGAAHRITDMRLDTLGISWDGNQPPELDLSFIGCLPEWGTTPSAATYDESKASYLLTTGGTFKVDTASGTPATAPIIGGSIQIARSLEPVMLSGDILPDDIELGAVVVDLSLTLKPSNLDEWRKAVTGSSSGTAVSQVPIYGSAEQKFYLDADTDATFTTGRVGWTGSFPETNAAGGPAELSLSGQVVLPAGGGNAFTSVVRNANASASPAS